MLGIARQVAAARRIVFTGLFVCLMSSASQSAETSTRDSLSTADDMAAAAKLSDSYEQKAPFSFKYNGESSAAILSSWPVKTDENALDANRIQRTKIWKDPSSGLSVRLVAVRYSDFPAIEWTAYLKNEGTRDTKLIDDLRGIDAPVGRAVAKSSSLNRPTWNAGKDFPQTAEGSAIGFYRGWVAAWKPMTKSPARFDTQGQAPWISRDQNSLDTILMMPAQGIEGATDSPDSGKSPAVAFNPPSDGVYRVRFRIALTSNTGDGVEWFLSNFSGAVLSNGTLERGQSTDFDKVLFLHAGDAVALTMHSRTNPQGDLCRVNFVVTQLTQPIAGDVVVHANKGSDANDMDYEPLPIGIAANESVAFASTGGRGSDGVAIPYFNIEMPTTSALLAVGWPGQWDVNFHRAGSDVRVSAGQQNVHAVLHPGEEIRTPLMALISYTGTDTQRGQNIWRRWMIAHNIPKVDGKFVGPFNAGVTSHLTAEMVKGTQANQIGYLSGYLTRGIKIDYWWMDAGWYENDGTWVNTGTWKVDRKRFPDGLRAVTDFAHSKGIRSIVWFEPERVTPNTELFNEHPGFLLNAAVDLNNPVAGLEVIRGDNGQSEPNIAYNPTDRDRSAGVAHWSPKQFTMHPGPKGEFAVARFTAPEDGRYHIEAAFGMCDPRATTDAHVVFKNTSLFAGELSPGGNHTLPFSGTVTAKRGETIDFLVGFGSNKNHACDSTTLAATITGADGKKYDVAASFKMYANPNGAWTYGSLPYGDPVAGGTLDLFNRGEVGGAGGSSLLNMGDPAARQWITDRIDSLIKSEGIDVYRQDFNIEPLNFWRSNDKPDRQGVTENLYIQGYLKFWATLLERNPKMYIDSCASGGRRNDLETMRRSVPFLRSDKGFEPTGQQGQSYGLFNWIPLHGTGTLVGASMVGSNVGNRVDPYTFRSDMTSIFTLASFNENDAFDYGQEQSLLAQYRSLWPFYFGDYYPLTPYSLDVKQWIGWQFYLPGEGSGFIQAFRREQADSATTTLKLHGLVRDANYIVTDADHPEQSQTFSGAALLDNGLPIAIDSKPGSVLLRYTREQSNR